MLRLGVVLGFLFAFGVSAAELTAADEATLQALRETLRVNAAAGTEVLIHYQANGFSGASVSATPERLSATEIKRRVSLRRTALKSRLMAHPKHPRRWLKDFQHVPVSVVELNNESELDALLADPDVLAVTPDLKAEAHLNESLPLIGQPIVVSSGATGTGTAVVVADTGVDYTRSAFGSCSAPGVPSGCRVVYAQDFAVDDGSPDANGHGSNVAGIVAGVATGTRIISADVFTGSSASSTDIIEAIDWAIANRATYNIVAINLSLGIPGSYYQTACFNPFDNPFNTAINSATTAGISVVTSAGNDANLTGLPVPACSANAVSVGAVYDANYGSRSYAACTDSTSAADQIGCFSNTGNLLDLLAPGAIITAAGVGYAGTSQAAPHAAAAVAIVKAEYPSDTPAGVLSRIQNGGVLLTDTRPNPDIATRRVDLDGIFPPPANNNFGAATSLFGSNASATGINRFGNKETSEPAHAGNGGGKSVWFFWTAPSSLNVSLNTSGSAIDTLLGVYTGTSVNALTTIASNDDSGGTSSALSFVANSGVTYRIALDGKNGAYGSYSLNLTSTALNADLAVTLLDSPDPVIVGGSTTYTLSVGNSGPNSASSVTALLDLPAGATAGALPSGCVLSGADVSCTLASLATSGNSTWLIPATFTSAGSLTATATVSSTTADLNASNNSATTTTTVTPQANLSVTLSDSPDPVSVTSGLSYTLTVSNAGPSTATSVIALLDLPLGVSAGSLPSGCVLSGSDVSCSLASLSSGANQVWVVPTSLSASGALTATASVSSAVADPAGANNVAAATTTVTPVADLSLTLAMTTSLPAIINTPVEVSVTVRNVGPSLAATPSVTLTLPPGIRLISTTGACSGSSSLACNLADVGASATAGFTVTLNASTAGSLSLTGSVSSTTSDPSSSNNSAALLLDFGEPASGDPVQVPALPLWAGVTFAAYVVLRRGALRRRG